MARATKSIKKDPLWKELASKSICGLPSSQKKIDHAEEKEKVPEEGISAFWRKNTSQIESIELANVLRALRKVSGHIGENVGRIEWLGMSGVAGSNIVLDPGLVMGKYPVPSKKFDHLTGIVTHESLHITEWTDYMWKTVVEKYNKAYPDTSIIQKVIFQKIVYTGEDIYIDQRSKQSVLGKYTQVPRRDVMNKLSGRFLYTNVCIDELLLLWWKSAFDEQISSKYIDIYKKPLSVLNELTSQLAKITSESVIERCKKRSALYLETWESIYKLIDSWLVIDKFLIWHPENFKERAVNKSFEKQKKSKNKALTDNTTQDIEFSLAVHSNNITPIIRRIVGEDNEDIVPMSRFNLNVQAHPIIDYKMVARLKAVFQNYAERKTLANRGLTSGRVDARKLHRAPTTGRCFYEKQKIPLLDWNICLLIDASGSMVGPRWRMVENTLGAIYCAFRGFQGRLQAHAYFEVDGICMISRLTDGKKLMSVAPIGLTASGQAIIAAAYFMPRDQRRRFLIHVTDGKSNRGCDVQYGIDYCQEQKINLVTLGITDQDHEEMKIQYGKSIQFLDHFGQLPTALENLFKWALVYGKRNYRAPALLQ